jgi:hypothetical protein
MPSLWAGPATVVATGGAAVVAVELAAAVATVVLPPATAGRGFSFAPPGDALASRCGRAVCLCLLAVETETTGCAGDGGTAIGIVLGTAGVAVVATG